MNYLPRSVFECERKVRHATEDAAKQAERNARARGAEWIRVYRCRYCDGGYHIGHVTNWKQLAQLARDQGYRRGTMVSERTGEGLDN